MFNFKLPTRPYSEKTRQRILRNIKIKLALGFVLASGATLIPNMHGASAMGCLGIGLAYMAVLDALAYDGISDHAKYRNADELGLLLPINYVSVLSQPSGLSIICSLLLRAVRTYRHASSFFAATCNWIWEFLA